MNPYIYCVMSNFAKEATSNLFTFYFYFISESTLIFSIKFILTFCLRLFHMLFLLYKKRFYVEFFYFPLYLSN